MATVIIDPTVPPNSENPQNGAFRIREVAAWLLDTLGLNSTVPQTITIPSSPQIDPTTGLLLVRGVPTSQGLIIRPDGVNPTTTMDFAAQFVQTQNPFTQNITAIGQFNADCLIVGAQAGSLANGRDQAAAFGASVFYYLYIITGPGVAPATLASLTAPGSGGPTLPGGWNAWYFAGSFKTDGSGNVLPMYCQGNTVYYQSSQQVLAAGTGTSATAVSLASFVPGNAAGVQLYFHSFIGTLVGTPAIEIGITAATVTPATSFYEIKPAAVTGPYGVSGWTQVPNIAQQIFYKWILNGSSSQSLDIEVLAYTVPNGAS